MSDKKSKTSAQDALVGMLLSYDKSPAKADEILSAQFILSYKDRAFRRICQFIFLNVLRRKRLIEKAFSSLWHRRPAPKLAAIMQAAAAEILSSEPDKLPKIVDFWVNFAKTRCSTKEGAFANALLRKFPDECKKIVESAESAQDFAVVYSQPDWLVKRWFARFGKEKALEILKNAELPSEVFFRVSPTYSARLEFEKFSRFFETSDFAGFYRLKSGHWPDVERLLDSPEFYIQDPSTWRAPELLNPNGGDWLDLCAAPGGKSRAIADLIRANSPRDEIRRSTLVSVDCGNLRMRRLRENMAKVKFLKSRSVDCDLLSGDLASALQKAALPDLYDGVFLDAPCSNSGVLRRRPDARYRIAEADVFKCAEIQKKLLALATKFVKKGGKLVYSTCSIEPEENEEIAAWFLEQSPDFKLVKQSILMPAAQNDGAGYALFAKK